MIEQFFLINIQYTINIQEEEKYVCKIIEIIPRNIAAIAK